MKEWFESWFDTRYYHILYKNRDYSEAERFIQNLFNSLSLDKSMQVLDLACGKGRHAIFVNSLGYTTTGVDLSQESIAKAKQSANDSLAFFQHDMRAPIKNKQFDLVLNLFTSFGYFEDKADNVKVLQSIHDYLSPEGTLVIDFLNAEFVIKHLVPKEEKSVEGINFKIEKSIQDGFLVKDIRFTDEGEDFHFQEKVKVLYKKDFEEFLSQSDFEIESIYGDYDLNPIDSASDRLIIIAKKKA